MRMILCFGTGIGTILLSCVTITATAADQWLQFRGSNTQATADAATVLPADDKIAIAWEVPTAARGISSPIVVNGQVIITSSGGQDERDLYIEAFDAVDGSRRWAQTLEALGRPYTHPTSANASPSPASDGESIVALFSSCDLVCLGVDGSPRWYRALAVDHPRTGNDISMSSSVTIRDGVVAVQLENQGDSFAAGIDLATGETLWEHPRPKRSGWASPIAIDLPGGARPEPAFVFQNGDGIEILAARSGDVLRTMSISGSTTSSPTWADPLLLVPGDGLTAFDLSRNEPSIAWENSRLSCRSVSPVVRGDRVYVGSGSVLASASLRDGDERWQTRMRDIRSVWATPIATESGIYVIDQSGSITVIADVESEDAPERSADAQIIGTAQLTGPILATPAVSGNAIYVRSERSLIKLAP